MVHTLKQGHFRKQLNLKVPLRLFAEKPKWHFLFPHIHLGHIRHNPSYGKADLVERPKKGRRVITLSLGGFTCFVSRPCRDAGLSRHCEDFVLLYRVMQGLVPVGTNRLFSTILLSAYSTYFFGINSVKVISL